MRIVAEYIEQSLVKDFESREVVRSSSNFQKAFKSLETSAELSGSYAGFSASVSGSFSEVTDVEFNTDSFYSEKTTKEKTYSLNFLQIIREITTTVIIGSKSASKITSRYVMSVPVSKDKSKTDLDDMAKSYIQDNYGQSKGKITGGNGQMYEERTCVKRKGIK